MQKGKFAGMFLKESAAPIHKEIVDAATYSAGKYKQHSATSTANHSSRAIRVPDGDEKVVMDRAERAFTDHGMKSTGKNAISGAEVYASSSLTGEISFNNGVLFVTVKKK